MAAPHPPQGAQKQYTERPLKIFGEQYVEGQPLPVGVVIDPGDPPIFSDGQPRVLVSTGWVVIAPTEWVVSNRYTSAVVEVISDTEFGERFGGNVEE